MLNAGFDDDSGAAVCLSTGVSGVVEIVAVNFEVALSVKWVSDISITSICCCFKKSSSSNLC